VGYVIIIMWWRFGVAVAAVGASRKLIYVGPG